MLVLALMAGLLWLQRRHDLGFLWMTLACLFWSVRALAYFDQTVYLPPMWFEQFNPYNILLTAITLCAATLGNEMQQRRPAHGAVADADWRRRPRQALLFAFVSATLALIAQRADRPWRACWRAPMRRAGPRACRWRRSGGSGPARSGWRGGTASPPFWRLSSA